MGWFRRTPASLVDLITVEALARFGRFQFLGPGEVSGTSDFTEALQLVEPLRRGLYGSPSARATALAELERHAGSGDWTAVGAWKFAREFLEFADETAQRATDEGLREIASMRVTNLGIHLSIPDGARFEELMGHQAPNDGFWGPPVFDSEFGPTRQYYDDSAIAAAASRAPTRLPHVRGVEPGEVETATNGLWDFGMLMLRGPLVVPDDCRFEPNLVRLAVEAARAADHYTFVDRVDRHLGEESATRDFLGWKYIGAARFLEDYLVTDLTGTDIHARLFDAGLAQLRTARMSFTVGALTAFERSRLDA